MGRPLNHQARENGYSGHEDSEVDSGNENNNDKYNRDHGTTPPMQTASAAVATSDHSWAAGGALIASLATSAQALLTDNSKTVRAKALSCCLCILESGDLGRDGGDDAGPIMQCRSGNNWDKGEQDGEETERPYCWSKDVRDTLAAVSCPP